MQRRPFRIESLLAGRRPTAARGMTTALLRDDDDKLAHGAAELAAAMEAVEQACHVVLASAERIDENAKALASAADSKEVRRLATDIRAQVARLYEICNFHDIAGQRIAKVIGLLTGLDKHLSGFAAAPEEAAATPGLLNGPRLDGASGHISQDEVDALLR